MHTSELSRSHDMLTTAEPTLCNIEHDIRAAFPGAKLAIRIDRVGERQPPHPINSIHVGDPDEPFFLASIGKLPYGLLLLQMLAERGIAFDQPVIPIPIDEVASPVQQALNGAAQDPLYAQFYLPKLTSLAAGADESAVQSALKEIGLDHISPAEAIRLLLGPSSNDVLGYMRKYLDGLVKMHAPDYITAQTRALLGRRLLKNVRWTARGTTNEEAWWNCGTLTEAMEMMKVIMYGDESLYLSPEAWGLLRTSMRGRADPQLELIGRLRDHANILTLAEKTGLFGNSEPQDEDSAGYIRKFLPRDFTRIVTMNAVASVLTRRGDHLLIGHWCGIPHSGSEEQSEVLKDQAAPMIVDKLANLFG